MKTIIHIGQQKTATTSIQRYLRNNCNSYLKKGIYIPINFMGIDVEFKIPKVVNHQPLHVFSLSDKRLSYWSRRLINKNPRFLDHIKNNLENEVKKVYDEAVEKKCDKVVWSNEGLYLLNSLSEYQKLKNIFSIHSDEIEITCCFRDKEEYRESFTKQIMRLETNRHKGNPNNHPELSNPKSCYYFGKESYLYDYSRKKELLQECYDKCIFFNYCKENNVVNFLNKISLPICDKHTNVRSNVTNNQG